MAKQVHEFRDPVHTFIRVSTRERGLIDSAPVQRLRQIHQLSTSSLIYPGATHRRFEHSLGVMELSSRVFDVITDPDRNHDRLTPELRDSLFHLARDSQRSYWRNCLRMSALCHDIGHLPYSHAAEEGLFPSPELDHEWFTVELIRSELLKPYWEGSHSDVPIRPDDVAKLAVGQKLLRMAPKGKAPTFTDLEAILSEIITGIRSESIGSIT